jgi:kynurenine formamidase
VDAINHVVNKPDARAINQLPLEWFMAPGLWFDFFHKPSTSYITKLDIKEAVDKTGVPIQPQSAVLYLHHNTIVSSSRLLKSKFILK